MASNKSRVPGYMIAAFVTCIALHWGIFYNLQKQENRKKELAAEIARTDSIYKVRCDDMAKTYRATKDFIRGKDFTSEQDRDMANNALDFAYACRCGDLKSEYARAKDSLNTLYIQETRQR